VTSLLIAVAASAHTTDDIVLFVHTGPGPGEISLAWTGSGSAFDVHRSVSPAGITDPLNRLGTTGAGQWIDSPPDAPIEYYEIISNAVNRIAVAPLAPYVFLIGDTSGSMTSPTGFGPPDCPGAADTKLDHLKCAIDAIAGNAGEAVLGLGRFRQVTSGASCSSCTITGIDCTSCNTATGAGCTLDMSSDARLEVLVPLLDAGHNDILRWNDFVCGTCGDDISLNPEMEAAGHSPIGGSLKGIQRYMEGLQATDGTIVWPAGRAGFDPIRIDPLASEFLPGGTQCRPYLAIVLTDGDETCSMFSDTLAAATALLSTPVDGRLYRIETKAVGFGLAPGYAPIEELAHAGGAPDVPGVNEGFYPRDSEEMQQIVAQIVSNAVSFERCNDADDDCDGLVDEDFPDKGQACDDGLLGVCRGTGFDVCRPDGTGTECQITQPGGTPTVEICDDLDDDCDGAVDEGCGACVEIEVCGNGIDDNCNGQIDEGCTPCVNWIDVGGGAQIMQYEASKPDATPGSVGSLTSTVCSRPGAQPWTNITAPSAAAACSGLGARLCTEQEWQRACAVVAPTIFPIVEPASGTVPIYLEAEDFTANTPAATSDGIVRAWVPDYVAGFSGISALRSSPDTGAAPTAANAPTQAPRLDFELKFTLPGNHYVWVRMFAPNSNDNRLYVGVNEAPTTVPTQTLTVPVTGAWTWTRSNAINVTTTGVKFVSLFMGRDGVKVDAVFITRNNSTTAPAISTPPGGHWAFATNPDTYVPTACNGRDLDTDPTTPGNQDELFAAGEVPGGQCYANYGSGKRVFDLSGNVKEWTAPRAPGIDPIRGGTSSSEAEGLSCVAAAVADDFYYAPNLGFRCCR